MILSIKAIVYKTNYNFVHASGLKSNAFSSHFYAKNSDGEISVMNHIVYKDDKVNINRWFY